MGEVVDITGVPLEVVGNQVIQMLSLCGLCSTDHIARFYSHCKDPQKRVWRVIKWLKEKDIIESKRSGYDQPNVYRLSERVRKKHQLKCIRWDTQLEHKLAITDVYCDLGKPNDFRREFRYSFPYRGKQYRIEPDIFVRGMFIEVQVSYRTSKRWAEKRRLYELFFWGELWREFTSKKPKVVVIQKRNQQLETIGDGIGYELIVTNNILDIVKPPQ